MKTQYFVLTTEYDQVICVISNNGDGRKFKEAIEKAYKDHYTLKRAEIQEKINPNNYIDKEKQITVISYDEDDEKITDTINIVSVHAYA